MASKVPHGSHNGSHLKVKRGVFHYRRRLPGQGHGEVSLSLATRGYREAAHRAGLLDRAFPEAWERARMETDETRLGAALRKHLRQALDKDLLARALRPADVPVYGHWWQPGDGGTAADADLAAIRSARADLERHLASGLPERRLEAEADSLLGQFGLPEHYRARVRRGVMEAAIRAWDIAERRTMGTSPLAAEAEADPICPLAPLSTLPEAPITPVPVQAPPKPLASSLVEPFFVRRGKVDRATHQVMGQERGTLRRFIEACGDRPVDSYARGDVTAFLDTLRRLPNTYGKSPKDKDRSLAEIIAAADASGAARLVDKTVKRHLSALSQFFQTAVDAGHLTVAARTELVEDHRFREQQGARGQRDGWTSAELTALFSSPVWTGCHPYFRTEAGAEIVRDAKFWLPILALHHGARLEELADLYRRDVGEEAGTWFVRITATEERRLKTDNAERVLPLHPEVIRLGFIEYVESTAPSTGDPLFPDLEPQGKDRKRGPRITRWFETYRKALGLFRSGVAHHAFRHTAITRLRDAITDHQQDRHVDFLMGHARGGGEGRDRYDKGPKLKAVAETLALLRFPEIDLSHLHVRPE